MGEFTMPSLGADMERGTVSRWLVHPGDAVHRGDIVAVVETEKSDIEVEIFESGVIDELLVPEGARVPVGTPLARLSVAEVATAAARAETARPPWIPSSPFARRRAAELGVDLVTVRGTGPGGAALGRDVLAVAGSLPAPPTGGVDAATRPPAATTPVGEDRQAARRRSIGALMTRSKREIPHYYLSQHVDMSAALAWLEDANLQRAVTERLLPAALLLKATALAAREVPDVNGFYGDDGFRHSEAVHLGVGISLRQGGLIAPAIHDADAKDLDTLMADLRDLVKRARSLQLKSSEMTDATMTTTLLGDQGVENVYGIIYPPQVALVGFGKVVERPWAENGMLAVRPILHITLAADHRASDGHRGGLFLSAIERHLHHPEEL